MRIISWNINGIRSASKKGFFEWLALAKADVVGIQELRAHPSQLSPQMLKPDGWFTDFNSAQRPGYSGVGLYSRHAFTTRSNCLGDDIFNMEGRVQIAQIGDLIIANIYFPNGNGKNRDNSRIPYKLDFYRRLFDMLEPLRKAQRPILIMGDFNTAHQEIDLTRPKQNITTSGFRPEEREELSRWLEYYVDTFRYFEKSPHNYTWWSQRARSRERNVGWRIDYVLASHSALPFLKSAFIWPHVLGSDHCPVGVDLDERILSLRIGSSSAHKAS